MHTINLRVKTSDKLAGGMEVSFSDKKDQAKALPKERRKV